MVLRTQLFDRWLEAERRGADEDASRALSRLMRALPHLVPSPRLVENVLLEIGRGAAGLGAAGLGAPLARPLGRLFSWGGRAALVASLVLVSSVILWLPVLMIAWSPEVGDLLAAASGLVSLSMGWFEVALSTWSFLAGVGETTAVVLATPQAMLSLAVMMSVGLAALRWLCILTLQERSSIYADSI